MNPDKKIILEQHIVEVEDGEGKPMNNTTAKRARRLMDRKRAIMPVPRATPPRIRIIVADKKGDD